MQSNKKTKFYQAGTSEMFGKVQKFPQSKQNFGKKSLWSIKSFLIGWQLIIEKHMECLLVMVFCLIMKARRGELCHKKSHDSIK